MIIFVKFGEKKKSYTGNFESYKSMRSFVADNLKNDINDFSLYYQDDDGEHITIESDNDLKAMIGIILKIAIF